MARFVVGREIEEGATAETRVTLRLALLARVWTILAVFASRSPTIPITSLHE